MSKFVPREIVKQAKQIDLLTYFMNNNPSELVKKGAGTYSLKTHNSVIISNGLWHRFSTNEAGKTALDYLIKVEKMTLQEAVSSVLNRNITTYIKPKNEYNNEPKKLVIPEKAMTNKEIIDYLKNRGIDEDIINYCIENNLIYQENRTNNVVFLGYDDEHNIKYAGCRSTNEKRIMRDAKGSSKEFSFRPIFTFFNIASQYEVTDIFLVLVDFKNSDGLAESSYTLNLTLSGDNVETVKSAELTFNIESKRTFEITTSSSNVKFGDDFTISYAMQPSGGAEALYSGKKISLVLTAASSIPADTYMKTSDGTVYYHNLYNQFIIPCSNVIGENGEITISINSNMLENAGQSYDFEVELWIGATSNASLPLMGDCKANASLTVQDETKTTAALKVTGMTTRLIDYDELSNTQEITFNYIIDSNCTVTIELQQKIGSAYEKVSDKLNSINGSTTHNAGVYTVSLDETSTSDTINFKLSTSTDIGTYRLVFKIYDENSQQILEVPYNFLVI